MKIGVFGAFYPDYHMLGNATTGLVLLLSELDYVSRIDVYCPRGSQIPDGVGGTKIALVPCWEYDSVSSLMSASLKLLHGSSHYDVLLFNIHLTSFGKSPVTNAVGLSIPPLVSQLSRRPTAVLMYNFVETQDIGKLGYDVGSTTRRIASRLEERILRHTHCIAPLETQRETLEARFGVKMYAFPLPYIESYYSAIQGSMTNQRSGAVADLSDKPKPYRVLFFGTWGPQKDLEGAVRAIKPLVDAGEGLEVTIIGAVNLHFPAYGSVLKSFLDGLPPAKFHVLGSVPEDQVFAIFRDHDLLILPYNETGGYSGVLNCAALAGTSVVSYDLPQLREQVRGLDADITFVPAHDATALRDAVSRHAHGARGSRSGTAARLDEHIQAARSAVDRIGRFLNAISVSG